MGGTMMSRRRTGGRWRRLAAAVAVATGVLATSGVAAAEWAPSEELGVTGHQYLGTPSIAYDASGRAYALYSRFVANFVDELYLRERPPGGPWGPPQLLPVSTGSYLRDATMDVNANGDVVVAFRSWGIHVVRRPAGGAWSAMSSWNSPGAAGPASGCPNEPFVDQDEAGNAVLTWTAYNSCNGLVTRWRVMAVSFGPSTGWEASPQVWDASDSDVHSAPSVAMSGGTAVVAFTARNGGPNGDRIWTVERTGGTWGSPSQFSTLPTVSSYRPGLDARNGTFGLVWYGMPSGAYGAVRTASGWSGAQSLPGVFASLANRGPSVAVDGTGAVHAATTSWTGSVGIVGIASREAGGGWTSTQIASPTGANLFSADIAANDAGDLALAFTSAGSAGWQPFSALKPADGVWPPEPTAVSPAVPGGNDPLPRAAVDPWGHGLVVAAVVGTNGFVTALPAAIETREPAAPPTDDPPVVVPGAASVGTVLTCQPGTFAGTPPFRYAYQWLQDSVALPGATDATFTVRAEDANLGLSCLVTAANEAGSAEAVSGEVFVTPTPPVNTAAPTVTGTMAAGEVVGCLPGTWTGAPPPEFTFEWQRNGAVIPFEEADTYALTIADGGSAVGCRVTATNVAGTAVAASATRSVPVPVAPTNTVRPALTGPTTPSMGDTLACSTGTWAGSPTPLVSREWLRGGVLVPGAYDPTYTLTASDAGTTITCRVTGSNVVADTVVLASGSRTLPGAPVNTRAPSVGAAPGSSWAVGKTARCNPGGWTNAVSFAYQWTRDGAPIPGATLADRVLDPADAGTTIGCTVTGIGRFGQATASSAGRAVAPAPVATVGPTISGTPRPGRALTCNRGTWTNASSFAYSWTRNGAPVGGTTTKYTPVAGDVGAAIACKVAATGPGGTTVAASASVIIQP